MPSGLRQGLLPKLHYSPKIWEMCNGKVSLQSMCEICTIPHIFAATGRQSLGAFTLAEEHFIRDSSRVGSHVNAREEATSKANFPKCLSTTREAASHHNREVRRSGQSLSPSVPLLCTHPDLSQVPGLERCHSAVVRQQLKKLARSPIYPSHPHTRKAPF